MRLFRPRELLYLEPTAGRGLARLSGMEGLSRSMLSGVVPLMALEALGDKQTVSITYSLGAIFALMMTINLGTLEKLIQRRWVVHIAISFLFSAGVLMSTGTVTGAGLGIGLRSAAASMFSVMLMLYVMDYVGKRDLIINESKRLFYNGFSWLLGPVVGIWLWDHVHHSAPFLLSATISVFVLAYYWRLRLGSDVVVKEAKSHPTSPLRTIPRYFNQRYMRIAYAITLIRSMFWVAIFVYGPLYVTEAGLAPVIAGVMLSGVASLLLAAPFVRVVAQKVGTRALARSGFLVIAAGMIGLGTLGEPQPWGVALWVLAALGGSWLDVVGNIPFMRLVKPRERVQMATVFSTWREMSEFAAPGLAAVVLAFNAPFESFYFTIGGLALLNVGIVSFLPRRL